MNFAIARAKTLNYVSKIKKPQLKECKLTTLTSDELYKVLKLMKNSKPNIHAVKG